MRLRDVLLATALFGLPVLASLIRSASATTPLYMHIKHASPYPFTLGKVRQIYADIQSANKTGLTIGLEPQVTADWATTLSYLGECGDIPVMLTILSSDDNTQLTTQQITEARSKCNVRWLRFHEAMSWFNPFPTEYVQTILAYAKSAKIPIFWNEWDVNYYPAIASLISGYEDNVAVSFGTNNNLIEPREGFALLQQFQRRGASVQSWYWWERNGRQDGYEYTMPPELMREHTQQAFQAGCEVVQFEPFGYFFDATVPKQPLSAVFNSPF